MNENLICDSGCDNRAYFVVKLKSVSFPEYTYFENLCETCAQVMIAEKQNFIKLEPLY